MIKFTISWKTEVGYVFADDGTKIGAQKSLGGMQAVVKDGSGKTMSDLTADLQKKLTEGYDNSTDCHGTTFAKGQVWINNDQVEKIIKGDGYTSTSAPGIGDVGIYAKNGNLSETRHSVMISSVNAQGAVTGVLSKSGIEPERRGIAPGPGPNTAWRDPTVKLQYFTQRVSQQKR